MAEYEVRIAVTSVTVRGFARRPPPAEHFTAAVQFAASPQPVCGFLVGVTDGAQWGWWGPVTEEAARHAPRLFSRSTGRSAAAPGQWAARLRRGTRHAHAGELAVAVGAFELACWDLLGQLHGVPVWRLLTPRPACRAVGTYATCFGIRLDHPKAPEVVSRIGAVWPVQKWRPVRALKRPGHPGTRALVQAGPGRVALDFGGAWTLRAVLELCSALSVQLSFVEEPCPAGELTSIPAGSRPARIAAGEHCYNPDDIAVLELADVDIWQPDAVFCGGFSRLRMIARTAAANGRALLPHGGGMIPAVHAAVAGSVLALAEFHLLMELRRQAHLARPLMPARNGLLPIPDLPGWGGPLHPDLQ